MNTVIAIKNEHVLKCAELYINVFNAEPWNDRWITETAHKRLNDIYVSPNFEGILYMEDGEVKGAIFGNYEQFYEGLHYNLKEMFIAPDLQQGGIDKMMLTELEKRLRSLRVTTIILSTSRGNKTSDFYFKNNFSEWKDMIIMGKDI